MHFIEQGGVLTELVLSDMKGEILSFEESSNRLCIDLWLL